MTLIVVNSMPKSGSTWFYQLVRQCLHLAGYEHPTDLTGLNARGNPGAILGPTLEVLLAKSRNVTLAIKAHRPSNPEIVEALLHGRARGVFLTRHPLSIVQSTLAFADFCRDRPDLEPDSPYAKLFTPDDAADFLEPFVPYVATWRSVPGISIIRYEELFSHRKNVVAAVRELVP